MISMLPSKLNSSFFIIDLITTDKDKKYAPAGRMAEAIISITKEIGDCLPKDLSAVGFTPDEVAEYWHMAHSLAAVEIRLIDGMRAKSSSLWRRKK